MTQCQTSNAQKLKLAAEKKEDESILIHIREVDCVAAEVCYHKNCFMSYKNFVNSKVNDQPLVQLYDESCRITCDQTVQKNIINDRGYVHKETVPRILKRLSLRQKVKTHLSIEPFDSNRG